MKASGILSKAISASSSADAPGWSPAERFRLTGPRAPIDARLDALRPDLADIALADRLFAPYYAAPLTLACSVPSTMMRAGPSDDSEATSQLLQGEGFAALDIARDWAWGYSVHDHYVGYVRADAIGTPPRTTHIIDAPSALLFAAPDIKSRMLRSLPIGSRLAADLTDGFLAADGGFIHPRHARTLAAVDFDPARIAENLIGMPYLWGGRGGGGIDCSGLVQIALGLCGTAAPRDSDQQRTLGREVPDGKPLARGDLIFFPGHVGIMADGTRLIHANAHWMMVTVEPLDDVVARLVATHPHPILCRRRLDP